MLHIGRTIDFLSLVSCRLILSMLVARAQFLAVAEHQLIPSGARSVGLCCVKLVISRFGPLPVRIRLLVVMRGLGWSV